MKNLIQKIQQKIYLRRVLQIVWQQGALISTGTALIIAIEYLLFFSTLYFTKELLNQLSSQVLLVQTENQFYTIIFWQASGLAILYAMVRVLSTYLIEILGTRLNLDIEEKIHEKVISLEGSQFENPHLYDVIFRARQAGSDRPNHLFLNAIEIVKQLFSLLAIAIFITNINAFLIPLVIVFVLPVLWVKMRFARKLMNLQFTRAQAERKAAYFSELLTSAQTSKEIRLFSIGAYFKKRYLILIHRLSHDKLNYSKHKNLSELFANLIAVIGIYVVIAYLLGEAVKGSVEIGEVVIVIALVPQAFSYLQSLATQLSFFYQNNTQLGYIFNLLALPENNKSELNQIETLRDASKLELQNLSYRYPSTANEVLKDITLTIERGKIIALVGFNGAGKSTLVNLILGMLKPSKGNIYLDGKDVSALGEKEYLAHFSGVLQDFVKYNGTLAENICFENLNRTNNYEELMKALGFESLLKKLDLNTILGKTFDGGMELSIGEWQKIAITRALLKPSDFLLLDEATSAMDVQSEQHFLHAVRRLCKNRGVLIISHRLATVQFADYVYILKDGTILEGGSPAQLLESSAVYRSMFVNV